jgi:CopG family nickel-responsive transcriptional regulator
MERLTISMSDEFASEIADFVKCYRYENTSEAIRDLARLGLKQARINHGTSGPCVATLSYVFNHNTRDLSKRLTEAQHDHHDLQIATMHIHLDHENCLEVAVLRGDASAVTEFSKEVIAERGVKHGHVSFVPITVSDGMHSHGHSGHAHAHSHTHPKD